MAETRPSRENAQLAVAAVRVLLHKHVRPPTPAEIGELLDWGDEETHVVLYGLVEAGILRANENPFEVRYELLDHLKVEELPLEADREALQDEVDDFKKRSELRHKEIEEMLRAGGTDNKKKQQMEELEKQFSDFKKEPPVAPE